MFISLYISIWPNVAVLNDQYIKFFGQRTRQLLEIWYKLLNHFVKGYSVNTEIFAPVLFCFFRPRRQQANLGLGEFHCPKISLFHHNFVWVNLKGGETLCKWWRAKITLSTVSTILNPSDADFEFEELDSVEFPETQYCSVKCQGDALFGVVRYICKNTRAPLYCFVEY